MSYEELEVACEEQTPKIIINGKNLVELQHALKVALSGGKAVAVIKKSETKKQPLKKAVIKKPAVQKKQTPKKSSEQNKSNIKVVGFKIGDKVKVKPFGEQKEKISKITTLELFKGKEFAKITLSDGKKTSKRINKITLVK